MSGRSRCSSRRLATLTATPSRWPRCSRAHERAPLVGAAGLVDGGREVGVGDQLAGGGEGDGVVLRAALVGDRRLALADDLGADRLGLQLELARRRLGRQRRGQLGPALQEVVGHRARPRPQLVRRVRQGGVVRERGEQGVVDRQRELALHLGERQLVAAGPRERRARLAGAVGPGVPRPADQPGHDRAAAVQCGLLRVREQRRADASPLRRGIDVDVELGELEVVEQRRADEAGTDDLPVEDGRPAAQPGGRPGVLHDRAQLLELPRRRRGAQGVLGAEVDAVPCVEGGVVEGVEVDGSRARRARCSSRPRPPGPRPRPARPTRRPRRRRRTPGTGRSRGRTSGRG